MDEKAAARASARAARPGAVSVPADDVVSRLDQRIAEKTRATVDSLGSAPSRAASQAEQDAMAKRMGRASRSTEASSARVVAPHSSPQPGAFSSSVDYKIAAKVRANAANSSRNTSDAPSALQSTEDAIRAKIQSNESSSAVRPGAVASVSVSGRSVTANELASFEADILAKQRARPGAVAERVDTKIASKARAANESSRSTRRPGAVVADVDTKIATKIQSGGATKPGAQPGLQISEDLVRAKVQGGNAGVSRVGVSSSYLDAKVAAKIQNAGATQPGAQPELQSLEDLVRAKIHGQAGANSAGESSSTMDAKIATKIQSGCATKPGVQPGLKISEDLVQAKVQGSDAGASRVGVSSSCLDAKVAAKIQNAGATQPGAQPELQSLEDLVRAKIHGQAGASSAGESSSTMDAKIATKIQSGNASKLGAQPGLQILEDSVRAKMQGQDAGASSMGATASNVDDKIGAKIQNQNDAKPGVQNVLKSLEASVLANVRCSTTTSNSPGEASLDLCAKTTAKIESDVLPRAEQGLRSIEQSIRTKIENHNTLTKVTEQGVRSMEQSIQTKLQSHNALTEGIPSNANTSNRCIVQELRTTESAIHAKLDCHSNIASENSAGSPNNDVPYLLDEAAELSNTQKFGAEGWNEHTDETTLHSRDSLSSNMARRATSGQNELAMGSKLEAGPTAHTSARDEKPEKDPAYRDDNDDLEYGEYGGPEEKGLAIAFAVEEDDDMFLPSAVEFDPDAKPSMYRNRRFRLYACFAMVAIVTGTMGAVLGMVLSGKEPIPEALVDRATFGIQEYVETLVGREQLEDPTNPYRKALDWIQSVDPMALTPESKKFTQRYLAAYFYYSTSTLGDWKNGCEPSTESDDCTFTFSEAAIATAENIAMAKRWLSSNDVCLWAGVRCDRSEQIYALDFAGSNMTGTFPEGIISGFPMLQWLCMSHGALEGTLPATVGDWKYILNLELAGNLFSGTIPDHWFNSRSLEKLNVGVNKLTGTVSSDFGRLRDLRGIVLNENLLEGTIPTELGYLLSLAWVRLDSNQLTGSIPTTLGEFRNVADIRLHRNNLGGSLPSELGRLTSMYDLFVSSNNLTGTIPTEFSNLVRLNQVEISNNQLHGSLVPLTFATTVMSLLRIENNKFTGSLPVELNGLKELEHLYASGNMFTGSVPTKVCNMVKPADKDGSNKRLVEFQMDCLVPPGGLPEVDCPCCTHCCDSDGANCQLTVVD